MHERLINNNQMYVKTFLNYKMWHVGVYLYLKTLHWDYWNKYSKLIHFTYENNLTKEFRFEFIAQVKILTINF
jgi:hypothetical protein